MYIMQIEARKRTPIWWLGRLSIVVAAILVAVPMLFGGSKNTGARPAKEQSAPPQAPLVCEVGWEPVTYPAGDLGGVTAVSPSHAWIGGTHRVLSWDGSHWGATPLPTQISYVVLERDSASSGNNVWGRSSTGAARWDGTNWNLVPYPTPTPPPPPGTNRYDVYSVGAWSPGDAWITGGYYDDNDGGHPAVIFHWNGVQWNYVPFASKAAGHTGGPQAPLYPEGGWAGYNHVYSVAIAGPDEMWAIHYGDPGPGGIYPFHSIVHVTPAGAVTVVPSTLRRYFNSIAVAGSNDVWIFGTDTNSGEQSIILHWNGTGITEVAHPNVGSLDSSVAIAPDNIWATVSSGGFLHWDGSTWSIEAGTSGTGWRLAGSGPSDIWAVNSTTGNPAIMHYPDLPTFTDVPLDNPFYSFVRCLACRGIISGYADGTFRPGNPVSRGQLAKIVSNAAGFNDPAGPQLFEDIAPGSTFYDYVQRLASRGYIGGYPCGGVGEPCGTGNLPYFRPNNNAARGQISKIVSNAAGFNDPAGAQMFEDVPPGSTFYDFIQRLASRNIINGYPCGGAGEPCGNGNLPYFRPNNNATRGQTSKIVGNTFFPDCQPPGKR